MSDFLARLQAANAEIEARDAQLREELEERRATVTTASEGGLSPSAGPLAEGVAADPLFVQETIVRRTGRPVLAVSRNQARLVFSDPESHVWKERLERAATPLSLAAAAVGRIEVNGHRLSWVGTGWFVADDIVVTNRHVAVEFARTHGGEFVFRRSILGIPMSASIDLLEEIDRTGSLNYQLERVLHIEEDEGPDVAFIRVAPKAGQLPPAPISLAPGTIEADEAIAVIGYPARDSRIPDLQLMDQIFGNVYDKKRLAPGLITRADAKRIEHDCSTLGGNSGSVLVSLRTGEAVGIHFAGTFLTANFAVPSLRIRERLDEVSRGSHVRPPVEPVNTKGADSAGDLQTTRSIDASEPIAAATTTVSLNLPIHVTVQLGTPTPVPVVQTAAAQPPAKAAADQPAATPVRPAGVSAYAAAIPWSADIFSGALFDAVARHDHTAAETLIAVFAQHVGRAGAPYPASFARRDLGTLRRKRQFTLMRRYVEAVLRSGTSDPQVNRQYAQALIESGSFDRAREVLDGILAGRGGDAEEHAEAQGLIGRLLKQQYVNGPTAPGASERLAGAVSAYRAVYERDPARVWHGINVASCTLRAVRDQLPWARREKAVNIAEAVLTELEKREQDGKLEVWDHATRVEAFLALDRQEDAAEALTVYLGHPDMDAFEVSSTHRQFTEVLQLDPSNEVVQRLWEAVHRTRAGAAGRRTEDAAAPGDLVPVLIRVATAAWEPPELPGIRISGRMGTAISADISRESLPKLLSTPGVISVEESAPVAANECTVSVPFIGVKETYLGPAGPFEEKGDRALIAIIDDGIDVLHEAFLGRDGKSRIVGIWDQRDPTGPRPAGFDRGTLHTREDVARYVTSGIVPDTLGRHPKGHGTHVASIAAGQAVGPWTGGVAPEASLLVVISDTTESIGYSKAHVMALDFIDRVATDLRLPVVVNVSQGMNAGAHDGSSTLEDAFNSFAKNRRGGRIVVKSAGNERDKKRHAAFNVSQQGQVVLPWTRSADARSPVEQIELWWNAGNEFAFTLIGPRRERSERVSREAASRKGRFSVGGPYSLDLIPNHPDQGAGQLRLLIGRQGDPAREGTWGLEVFGASVRDGLVHAWIERSDERLGLHTRFEDFESKDVTLSIPGTAEHVITVSAIAPKSPFISGSFSSYGPTRGGHPKPDVAAPGVGISAACGGTARDMRPDEGTSMAAPHVTGAIALMLSKLAKAGAPLPTGPQVRIALQQSTINHSAWNKELGFGVVDVSAFLASL